MNDPDKQESFIDKWLPQPALLLPVLVFLGISVALYAGLSLNPREIPSVLKQKPVPVFDLPGLEGRLQGRGEKGLASSDFRRGQVTLLNVFASWCVGCRVEHPVLMEIARRGDISIHGLDYKDKPENGLAFLQQLGDPYDLVGVDLEGRVGIDLGVYGIPETFVIDGLGQIVDKHIGPLSMHDFENKILPLIEKARQAVPVSGEAEQGTGEEPSQ